MKIFGWLVRRYQLEAMFQGEVRTLQIDDSKIKPLRDALSISNGRRTDGLRYQTRKTPEGLQVVLVSSELLTDSDDWQIDTTRDCTADVMDTTLRNLNASAKRRECRYRFRAAGPSQIIKRRIWQRRVHIRPESFHQTLRAIRNALHGGRLYRFRRISGRKFVECGIFCGKPEPRLRCENSSRLSGLRASGKNPKK